MILSGLTVFTHATLAAVSGTNRQHIDIPVKVEIIGLRFRTNGTAYVL
jgi:hypothetical protein